MVVVFVAVKAKYFFSNKGVAKTTCKVLDLIIKNVINFKKSFNFKL